MIYDVNNYADCDINNNASYNNADNDADEDEDAADLKSECVWDHDVHEWPCELNDEHF